MHPICRPLLALLTLATAALGSDTSPRVPSNVGSPLVFRQVLATYYPDGRKSAAVSKVVFWARGSTPTVSSLNGEDGFPAPVNAVIVPLGTGGAITVQVDGMGTVEILKNVSGYIG